MVEKNNKINIPMLSSRRSDGWVFCYFQVSNKQNDTSFLNISTPVFEKQG